jgi:glutathione S-transferase
LRGEETKSVAKPEIIGASRSSYTRVVRMVCEEKAIDYILTDVLLGAPELAIHPFGKMPVLRHGNLELFESKAIATYLDRVFPGPQLIPADPCEAALTEQWVSLVNTVVDRTMMRTYLIAYIAPKTSDGAPDRAAIEAVMPAVREQLAVLDRAVAATGHLVGERFTLADINLMPILHRLGQFPEGSSALAAATHLARYYAAHAARPSFVRTDPPAGPPRRAASS